ncbi:FMN-linked oxidoreductase [Macrolepiota fuliginosa MF-IS2]|uniref:tRNA-dihydrouridine(47) synthase [NAD(P)(+)] n=1 Tax=Macrolepiota fuliginosa MF-IS2 TaxID=1400762 RepID=A0A9P5XQC7_9AGAR|nr:FMN-linked oxidoreductase [Macrolepiota fuliginosa MF-IS2]
MTKAEKKATRGANKGRRFGKTRDEVDLCWKVANGSECEHGENCKFAHDIPAYLAAKVHDLRIPDTSEISDAEPFIKTDRPVTTPHPDHPSLDLGTTCPVFTETGECRYGFKCRFLGAHIRADDTGKIALVGDEDKKARSALTANELNSVNRDIQNGLRTKKYPLPIATAYLDKLKGSDDKEEKPAPVPDGSAIVVVSEPEQNLDTTMSEPEPPTAVPSIVDELVQNQTGDSHQADDNADVPFRFREKKRLHWTGKTYLAPLTTVGNLPFRRLCVSLGADITCGEMGLANSFLAGSKEEWSLVRRHPSEKIFGVQVAGNKPANLVPTAEVIAKELVGGVDFVDVNCGCPIDLVFKQGSGSALIDAPGKLGRILVGMNKALGDIPVTVKLRTGVKEGKNTAHKLMPRVSVDWGASCLTLHGRTRQQRYTRLADWDYIRQCVAAVRAREEEEDLPSVPIFGGGDCFSAQDYYSRLEESKVDGIMVGRGALIKPWIFTEIKERREWDISARERLDLVRDYVNYGLNHFGSDTAGVNTTRRYLCEALSFQYRYVPIGLLEQLPGRINDRAPAFRGRSDLETLLSSGDSRDWIKISEMFLGPAPESWTFIPKHKSNSYESQG